LNTATLASLLSQRRGSEISSAISTSIMLGLSSSLSSNVRSTSPIAQHYQRQQFVAYGNNSNNITSNTTTNNNTSPSKSHRETVSIHQFFQPNYVDPQEALQQHRSREATLVSQQQRSFLESNLVDPTAASSSVDMAHELDSLLQHSIQRSKFLQLTEDGVTNPTTTATTTNSNSTDTSSSSSGGAANSGTVTLTMNPHPPKDHHHHQQHHHPHSHHRQTVHHNTNTHSSPQIQQPTQHQQQRAQPPASQADNNANQSKRVTALGARRLRQVTFAIVEEKDD
jgi:hypothetical protein